jgi:NAD(P)-dependent dehydrogenase (short-subunit alcohol dehydrogenase family)
MGKPQRRVVLVTGASSGIGKATAEHLHAAGYRVYGASRRTLPCAIPWLTLDVTDDASVAGCIVTILRDETALDAVINCAGYGIAGAVEETSIEEARAQFETNFFGTLRVCRAVLPAMRAQHAGLIVNIGSLAGLVAIPFQSLYSASKFALEGLTEALRMEVKQFGIDVSLIEPGDFHTGFTAARIRTAASTGETPYQAAFTAALGQMERDETSGPSPAIVARLVERIVQTAHPRLRYRAGKPTQTFSVSLKHVLPGEVFEGLVMQAYGMGRKKSASF